MKKWLIAGLVLAAALVVWRTCSVGGDDPGPSTISGDAGKPAMGSDGSTTTANAASDASKDPQCNIQTAPLNEPSVHCPQQGGFAKCDVGSKCCPKGASACVAGSEMCSTGKLGFECFSSAQCKNNGGVWCGFAQKTASMFQPCTKPQLTFDNSESSSCTTLANCPKTEPRRTRLCPTLGTSEGCDPSETCKERFTYLQGYLMTIYACE